MVRTTEFQEKVYHALRKVPAGKVITYGDLASVVGVASAQAIGGALKRNPYSPQVPCHRVVSSDGSIGGFMGCTEGEQIDRKTGLLRNEGIKVVDGKVKDFSRRRFIF
jgi:methylated-DNA-[protein]-cysteine S-methyltransferase